MRNGRDRAEGTAAAGRVLRRELETLRRQVQAYPDERQLWTVPAGLANSAGTLAIHLCGNLQHFVGALLGGTGYVRDRDREFAVRGLAREEILAQIARAEAAVGAGLLDGGARPVPAEFPVEFGGARLPTLVILARLVAHFGYHLGQIDVHRRIVTGNAAAIEEPPVAMLAE